MKLVRTIKNILLLRVRYIRVCLHQRLLRFRNGPSDNWRNEIVVETRNVAFLTRTK